MTQFVSSYFFYLGQNMVAYLKFSLDGCLEVAVELPLLFWFIPIIVSLQGPSFVFFRELDTQSILCDIQMDCVKQIEGKQKVYW